MGISFLLKNWKTILVALIIAFIGIYIINLKSTINNLNEDIHMYKTELDKSSREVERLSKVNLDNLKTLDDIKRDANKSVALCKSQYSVTKHKEIELLNIIESLKLKVNTKPKVKTVYKLKKCEVIISEEDNNDKILFNLNKQLGGL